MSDQVMALLLAVAEAERWELIEDQQHARLAPSNAVRPLTGPELDAAVRFADLEEDRDAAVLEAEELMAQLHEDVRDAILVGLFGEARAGELTSEEAIEVIHAINTQQPVDVAEAESSAVGPLAAILLAAYLLGGRRSLEEAGRQGVPVSGLAPASAQVEDFIPAAQAAVTHPWRRIIGKVEEQLTSQAVVGGGTVTTETVTAVLDGIKVDGSVDQARQAINTSAGTGRSDTVAQVEALATALQLVFASELMDGETCGQCAPVDGREYQTLQDALEDYPQGLYRWCDGGYRCRGTLIYVYS